MSEPKPENQLPAKPADANTVPPEGTAVASELTKEEQWALFEKELKENDWGHQPC
jgi:hypothetical protein